MIHSGLVSISFRQLNTDEIIDLVSSEGLTGIEWGGDLHVPHGKLDIAQDVADKTYAAGLTVAAYGSYYMVGVSKEKGLAFDDVLNTAIKLKTDKIRLWAGDKNSEDADADWTKKIVTESKELAKKAADQGVMLVYEFHNNTMTNTYKSAVRLMESIDNPNFQSYWQPINGMGVEENSKGLDLLLPWIKGVHCFHWWPDAAHKLPLKDGAENWNQYFAKLKQLPLDFYTLLEFVADNKPENFRKDAKTLKCWLDKYNSKG